MDAVKQLPVMNLSNNPTGCCPVFDPALWDKQIFSLEQCQFVKANTRSLFHMPLNMGRVMTRAMAKIESSKAVSEERYLILSRDLSPWESEHHFLVTRPVADMPPSDIKGIYYAEVYEGPFRLLPQWLETFSGSSLQKGFSISSKDVYAFYTTCPKCAKAYGHNYVVLFGRVDG